MSKGGLKHPRVLLIALEFSVWRRARHWSYTSQLGLEEGLRANGVECFTITTPWLSCGRKIFNGRRFDQVWVEIVHSELSAECLTWIGSLAPIRIGLIFESLRYDSVACATFPELSRRRDEVERRLGYFTHVLAVDEMDAAEINGRGGIHAAWCPQAVPERFICEEGGLPMHNKAVFGGALYGTRSAYLENAALKPLLRRQVSPEDGTLLPFCFDALHTGVEWHKKFGSPAVRTALPIYLQVLRYIRERTYHLWLRSLRTGCAVVNLPSFLKAYPGRVVEAMAAGRPVISWKIPERPKTQALFQDGKEILLYPENEPLELAQQIQRIMSEPEYGARLAANARWKLKRFHTSEKRTREILHWITTGAPPIYG